MKEKEAVEKGIDIKALEKEQEKLGKLLVLKDTIDFSLANRLAGIHTEVVGNKILCGIAVLDENMEIIEEKYVVDRIKFPYIPAFRAYRELPIMRQAYDKLEEQPDIIFVLGHGIAHPRSLGIASHFGLSIEKPTIGIGKSILFGKEKDNYIYDGKKAIAYKLLAKEKAKPIYISPGHLISLKTSIDVTRKCMKGHKMPEPIVVARRYCDHIRKEVSRT